MSQPIKPIADLSPDEKQTMLTRLQKMSTQVSTFPVSYAQEWLWFLDQIDPDSPVYNIRQAVRLTGNLDVTALHLAIQTVVDRHEALRTTFSGQDGLPRQVVAEAMAIDLPLVDLSQSGEQSRFEQLQQITETEAGHPFDLSKGPLLRTCLVKLAETDHVLLLTLHHIIADGWSMGILFEEMTAAYSAFCEGREPELPHLPIQFADFAVWQRDKLQGELYKNQLAYWKNKLAGPLTTLNLPADYPRPARQTFEGEQQSLILPLSLTEQLKALAHQERVTLYMLLLAAFKVLLYRYSGQTDIMVGSPVANRNRKEIEGLIGFFVNTLVLRTDLGQAPTFRQLLQRVRETALEAYAHQSVTFPQLVAELQPERDPTRSALFQVMFAFLPDPMPPVDIPGLVISAEEVDNGTAKFDLTLNLIETEQGIISAFEYNTNIFAASTITRLLDHFKTLLENIVACDGQQSIGTIPLLSETERAQIVIDWNQTQVDYPQSHCLHQLIEAQVEQTPDAVAIVFEGQSLTYRQLNQRANQLAHHLQSLKVGPETLVGICVERGLHMITGVLAVLKAGGAYLPLEPSVPTGRLGLILDDARPVVLLTEEQWLKNLPATEAHIICFDRHWATIGGKDTTNLASTVNPDNLAYVIYTSGSTGRPKGTLIEHRSVVNFVQAAQKAYGLTPADRVLQFASLSFDASVEEIFPPLSCGATLVLRNEAMLASAADFYHTCHEWAISVASLPTAFWSQLTLDLKTVTLPPALRLMIIGGEAVSAEAVATWHPHVPESVTLLNTYGPTETTVIATLYQVEPAGDPVSIGRPIDNVRAYILDEFMQPVPPGVTGQLYIGGAGVGRGYLNQPALTAEKFLPDPFGSAPNGRLYKTGDLAALKPDGNIRFLGRVDDQVKIRGFRIELGEIETALRQHPAVTETIVAAKTIDDHQRLIAYLILEQADVSDSQLRRFLAEKLPKYMLPSAFVRLAEFPLTANGKVDRQTLPVPDASRPYLEQDFEGPRNPVEELLVDIWAEVLKLDQVGIHDNFFDLGGHSLLATQLTSRVRKIFKLDIPLRSFFAVPTVAGVADALGRLETRPGQLAAIARLRKQIGNMSPEEIKAKLRLKKQG